mmetsp:Transcript_66112/g.137802  ORF Transcript_66112/g.137802 Transcript_66112/m.137802 type:complete len:204 (-) Transcript_66112:43-654(-)
MNEAGLARKIVLVGNSGVGKTALVLRFVQGTYKDDYPGTIGGSYLAKQITVEGVPFNLQIWDTAGQERFRSMVRIYYRGASAAILCCDVTDAASFQQLPVWVGELKNVLGDDVILEIACTKCDLQNKCVTREQVEEYGKTIGASVIETSAKSKENVEALFETLAQRLLDQAKLPSGQLHAAPTTSLRMERDDRSRASACQGSC